MAHKKGLGSSRNGRDSNAKRLGVKVFAGEVVTGGEIIVRQAARASSPARASASAATTRCSRAPPGPCSSPRGGAAAWSRFCPTPPSRRALGAPQGSNRITEGGRLAGPLWARTAWDRSRFPVANQPSSPPASASARAAAAARAGGRVISSMPCSRGAVSPSSHPRTAWSGSTLKTPAEGVANHPRTAQNLRVRWTQHRRQTPSLDAASSVAQRRPRPRTKASFVGLS